MQSFDASSVLMLAGAAVAVYIVLRRSFGFQRSFSREEDERRQGKRFTGQRGREQPVADAPADVLRWQVEMHETARELKGELDSKLSALSALVLMARQESQRLEAAIRRAESVDLALPRDTLARIEGLAEPAALASTEALARVADEMPQLPGGVAADVFEADQKTSAIARLLEKGHPVAEISRRLGVPVGEIELLLSLRHS